MSYVLISFESPHHTIKADKVLSDAGIKSTVYPIPREISRDCGLGIRINSTDLDQILALFKERDILHKHTFPMDDNSHLNLIDKFTSHDQHD